MDETAFQRARETMTSRGCVFEKATLAGACGCSLADVRGLIEAACVKFGSLQNLPYPALIQAVAAWQLRRRRPEP